MGRRQVYKELDIITMITRLRVLMYMIKLNKTFSHEEIRLIAKNSNHKLIDTDSSDNSFDHDK